MSGIPRSTGNVSPHERQWSVPRCISSILVRLDRAAANWAAQDRAAPASRGNLTRILASKIHGSGGACSAGRPLTSLHSGTSPTRSDGQQAGMLKRVCGLCRSPGRERRSCLAAREQPPGRLDRASDTARSPRRARREFGATSRLPAGSRGRGAPRLRHPLQVRAARPARRAPLGQLTQVAGPRTQIDGERASRDARRDVRLEPSGAFPRSENQLRPRPRRPARGDSGRAWSRVGLRTTARHERREVPARSRAEDSAPDDRVAERIQPVGDADLAVPVWLPRRRARVLRAPRGRGRSRRRAAEAGRTRASARPADRLRRAFSGTIVGGTGLV